MATFTSALLMLFGLQIAASSFINMALIKDTSMSSIWDDRYPASKAVDGRVHDRSFDAEKGYIHTGIHKPYAWWKVDLKTTVQNATVRIYFRTDYAYRRNGVQIFTSIAPFLGTSSVGAQLCHSITGRPDGSDIPDIYNMACPGTWRYLLIYTETDNDKEHESGPVLDFGEVMVLVCDTFTYGDNCDKICSGRQCAVTPASCDRYKAFCPPGGCKPGYITEDCSQECPDGTFGFGSACVNCNTRHCLTDTECTGDGTCSDGCEDGWTLDNCTQECPTGYYGANCSSSCGKCLDSQICHHISGECKNGCEAGKRGKLCKEDCENGTYGVNCRRECGQCNGACDVTNGRCPNGCLSGHGGDHCRQQLTENTESIVVPVVAVVVVVVVIGVVAVVALILYRRRKLL